MPAVWFALKRSLQCKTDQSDVRDPRNNLTKILTKKSSSSSRSGCSRSIANLKDVINGSSKRHTEKPPESDVCSPRSIGSSELLNPITHEVVVNNSTCELKVTSFGTHSQNGKGANHFGTFMGTLKPGTPGPGGHLMPPPRGKGRNSAVPLRKSHSLSWRKSSSSRFGGIPIKPRAYSNGNSSGLSCHKCGEQFVKWESVEAHHLSKHAVTGLVEGDSSRKIVELIYGTSWSKPPNNNCNGIERILKVHNMQKTLAQFEEYREMVKIKASKLPKKHPRCLADGNELLRFYGTTIECSLGVNGSSSLCSSDKCNICQILRHGFISIAKELNDRIGVFTTSTSERAFESIQFVDSNNSTILRKALMICRVIAGRVHRPLENIQELVGQLGFDSLAGKVGLYANIEELYLLNSRALLPCFVIVCKP